MFPLSIVERDYEPCASRRANSISPAASGFFPEAFGAPAS
jgi:hypothetical protein